MANLTRTIPFLWAITIAGSALAADRSPVLLRIDPMVHAEIASGGRMSGAFVMPVVFRIDANRQVRALIAGTVASRHSNELPPEGQALIDALEDQRFHGFTDAQAAAHRRIVVLPIEKVFGQSGKPVPEAGATVLIRMGDWVTRDGGAAVINRVADSWEKTLRHAQSRMRAPESMIVIRVGHD